MMRRIIFICVALLLVATACTADEHTAYLSIIDSTDYRKQLEVLPLLLEDEKFAELFPPENYDSRELDGIYADLLLKYLIALMETNEDDLLRDNVVDIFRSFRR